jgi:AcrR family transcriptional regulator
VTVRERYREQVRDEAKRVALDQIAAGGPAALSINAIGKALGVSGPALYRYFENRDALLTALVVDAYEDLAATLEAELTIEAMGVAYRGWALAHPHRYRLLFEPPFPGFDASAERLVAAAQRSMNALLTVLPGDAPDPPRKLAAELRAWAKARGIDAKPGDALRAVLLWSRLHGFVSLELGGTFESMGLSADGLFAAALP